MKNKKGMNKLFVLLAVVLAFAMLIPVAGTVVAVSADDLTSATFQDSFGNNQSHDVVGDAVTFTVDNLPSGDVVASFSVADTSPVGAGAQITATNPSSSTPLPTSGTPATAVISSPIGDGSSVTVQSFKMGESTITANIVDDTGAPVGTLTADKKWGKIFSTSVSPTAQDVVTTWNESSKTWSGSTSITDTVMGVFFMEDSHDNTVTTQMPVAGVPLNVYLLQDTPATEAAVAAVSGPGSFPQINSAIMALDTPSTSAARFATFSGGGTSTVITSDGPDGTAGAGVTANGEEAVLVVIVPQYPGSFGSTTEFPVQLETAKINFWTSEMEVVPQVRWAGEKIVLEKFFGTGTYTTTDSNGTKHTSSWVGTPVRFTLEENGSWSVGSLAAIGTPFSGAGRPANTDQTVWSQVQSDGYARCMLESQDAGTANVDLTVYDAYDFSDNEVVLNQHSFVVYFLKLESITLGNVQGKRSGENTGLWIPSNPWDVTVDHTGADPADTLNVSTDALLRARVKGWFIGANASTRLPTTQDADLSNPGVYQYTLPGGRWVLPDDWPILAGPNWQEQRMHWDIMNAPNDGIVGADNNPLGPYLNPYTTGPVIAENPVIGPFRPGDVVPNATGYDPNIPGYAVPQQMSVVPNGNLDWWDAPMPPAQITFEITNGVGFFKDTMKTDVYYLVVGGVTVYTDPFYEEMIPAFSQIPAFVNNGGYDWDSWNTAQYGPYPFWKITDRLANGPVPSGDNANYPTKVQVYSDNHGEAMVWLNGNWNLDLSAWAGKGGNDVPLNQQVGTTTATAIANYPYFSQHNELVALPIGKNWVWGGDVLGTDNASSLPDMVLVGGVQNPNASDAITLENDAGGSYDWPGVIAGTEPKAQGTSDDHAVFVWVTDRDGMAAGVLGSRVDWILSGAGSSLYSGAPMNQLNPMPPNSTHLAFDGNGFLANTMGNPTYLGASAPTGYVGSSWLRAPTATEATIFSKFYPNFDPADFAVAAIDVISGTGDVTVKEYITGPDFATPGNTVGTIQRATNFTTTTLYPLDDEDMIGDANNDGNVNMMDVTAIENMILGKAGKDIQADTNCDGHVNMADAIGVVDIYLGLTK